MWGSGFRYRVYGSLEESLMRYLFKIQASEKEKEKAYQMKSLEDKFIRIPFPISRYVDDIKFLCNQNSPIAIERIRNFWTVGMATYKDGYKDLSLELIEKNNQTLLDLFPQLYKDQLEFFAENFKIPAKYMAGLPMPGFHVFKYCPEFELPLARPHVDVPFNKYDWGRSVEENDIFTHVVPLEIPEGAGMNVWDLSALDMHLEGADNIVNKARRSIPDCEILYNVDEMVLHSGKYVHQIKPFKEKTTKWRITLQSHAVLKDKCWQLYW